MTARELRHALTAVADQGLTVRELRERLFQIDKQDDTLTYSDLERL